MRSAYNGIAGLFAVVFVGLGFAILIKTALEGGVVGYAIGALFVALGSARLYLLVRR